MLIKVQHIDLFSHDEPQPMMDVWVNPAQIASVYPLPERGFWRIRTAGNDTFIIVKAQADEIIAACIDNPAEIAAQVAEELNKAVRAALQRRNGGDDDG